MLYVDINNSNPIVAQLWPLSPSGYTYLFELIPENTTVYPVRYWDGGTGTIVTGRYTYFDLIHSTTGTTGSTGATAGTPINLTPGEWMVNIYGATGPVDWLDITPFTGAEPIYQTTMLVYGILELTDPIYDGAVDGTTGPSVYL